MKHLTIKTISSTVILLVLLPLLVKADPPGPGDGSDPFAAPVNGGVAFVAVIAFLYGIYKIYRSTKKNSLDDNKG